MTKKYILLLISLFHLSSSCINDINKTTLQLKNFDPNKFPFAIEDSDKKKIKIGQFSKVKMEGTNYDSIDLRYAYNKKTAKDEFKITNYLVLPISNKFKNYWNELLIFKQPASIGLDFNYNLLVENNLINELFWKNNITIEYQLPQIQKRNLDINGYEKNILRQVKILALPSLIFNTALNLKKNNFIFEIGYNFLYKEKEHLKVENLDILGNTSSITNKFYFLMLYDFKIFNKIINCSLDISYSLISDKSDNVNILTTFSSSF